MTDSSDFLFEAKALAFDVDGTLGETDPLHAKAWRSAVGQTTGNWFDIDDYLEQCIIGAMSPQRFLRKYYDDSQWESIRELKRALYAQNVEQHLTLTDGLEDLVRESQALGILILLVSSSSEQSVRVLLDKKWTNPMPDAVISRMDGIAAKPDPAPYIAALETVGLAPQQVVAFEDSDAGIRSAASAGIRCVQVSSTISSVSTFAITSIRNFGQCRVRNQDGTKWISIHPTSRLQLDQARIYPS